MKSGTANVNGTSLYYETSGKGVPLVFVSGGGVMDCRCWDEQFELFAKDYQVIRYDVRGIGKSARPDRPFSHSRDLSELLKFLDVERAALVGLSAGGAIAIDFVIEYPDMVDRLVLAASGLSDDARDQANFQTVQLLVTMSRTEGIERLIELLLDTPFVVSKDNAGAREKIQRIYLDNKDVFESGLPIFLQWRPIEPPAGQRLTEIRKPVLVVRGDYDTPDYMALSDKLAASINGARKLVIPGGTHFLNLEKPKEFNEAMAAFLVEAA